MKTPIIIITFICIFFATMVGINTTEFKYLQLNDNDKLAFDEALSIVQEVPLPTFYHTGNGKMVKPGDITIVSFKYDPYTGRISFLTKVDYGLGSNVYLTYITGELITEFQPYLTLEELRTKELVWSSW